MPDTCQACGCKLGRTVKTPIDRSLGFTAMLELYPGFGQMVDDEGAKITTAFLEDWYASGHTDMWAYAKEWVAAREIAEHTSPPEPGTPGHEPVYGANADGNPYAQFTPENRVWALAQRRGYDAAQWVFNATTTQATFRAVLDQIRAGRTAVELAPASLRGDYTDGQILADAGWVPHDGTDLRDELIRQYDREVVQAFLAQVERLALEGAQS